MATAISPTGSGSDTATTSATRKPDPPTPTPKPPSPPPTGSSQDTVKVSKEAEDQSASSNPALLQGLHQNFNSNPTAGSGQGASNSARIGGNAGPLPTPAPQPAEIGATASATAGSSSSSTPGGQDSSLWQKTKDFASGAFSANPNGKMIEMSGTVLSWMGDKANQGADWLDKNNHQLPGEAGYVSAALGWAGDMAKGTGGLVQSGGKIMQGDPQAIKDGVNTLEKAGEAGYYLHGKSNEWLGGAEQWAGDKTGMEALKSKGMLDQQLGKFQESFASPATQQTIDTLGKTAEHYAAKTEGLAGEAASWAGDKLNSPTLQQAGQVTQLASGLAEKASETPLSQSIDARVWAEKKNLEENPGYFGRRDALRGVLEVGTAVGVPEMKGAQIGKIGDVAKLGELGNDASKVSDSAKLGDLASLDGKVPPPLPVYGPPAPGAWEKPTSNAGIISRQRQIPADDGGAPWTHSEFKDDSWMMSRKTADPQGGPAWNETRTDEVHNLTRQLPAQDGGPAWDQNRDVASGTTSSHRFVPDPAYPRSPWSETMGADGEISGNRSVMKPDGPYNEHRLGDNYSSIPANLHDDILARGSQTISVDGANGPTELKIHGGTSAEEQAMIKRTIEGMPPSARAGATEVYVGDNLGTVRTPGTGEGYIGGLSGGKDSTSMTLARRELTDPDSAQRIIAHETGHNIDDMHGTLSDGKIWGVGDSTEPYGLSNRKEDFATAHQFVLDNWDKYSNMSAEDWKGETLADKKIFIVRLHGGTLPPGY